MPAFSGTHLRFFLATLILCAAPTFSLAQNDPASRRAAIELMYPVMIGALEAKNFGRARNICDQAIIWEPQNPVHHYNLACIEAQAGGSRLPHAWGALELAIALGFDEVDHLKTDPDLAPLHGDPKFAELVHRATYNATAGAAIDAIAIPSASARAAPSAPVAEAEKPASAAFNHGVPVGLYFMTRYRTTTRALEKAAWYFSPDGTVYQNLKHGFSAKDLAAHAGPKGVAAAQDDGTLVVAWDNGTKTRSEVERDGSGFTWDMAIFTAVSAFEDVSYVAGIYDGEDNLSVDGSQAAAANRLELRADGTFTWGGISFVGAGAVANRLVAGTDNASTGRWQLSGHSLILTNEKGLVLRRIAFPDDDEKTVVKPDRMFFDGLMYKRQP